MNKNKNKIKVVNKGYTITVDSWEKDGDNSRTESITVDTLEEVKVWCDMMDLCSDHSEVTGLGNTYERFNKHQVKIVVDFFKENAAKIDLRYSADLSDVKELSDEDCLQWFRELSSELLGGGEYYCRVCDSYVVTYSPEDIYVEKIEL